MGVRNSATSTGFTLPTLSGVQLAQIQWFYLSGDPPPPHQTQLLFKNYFPEIFLMASNTRVYTGIVSCNDFAPTGLPPAANKLSCMLQFRTITLLSFVACFNSDLDSQQVKTVVPRVSC